MGDLRGPLVHGLERLATDLATGTHDDPHVAFTVLVYPDQEPAIIVISGSGTGADNIDRIRLPDQAKKNAGASGGRFFTHGDLEDAANAIADAEHAMDHYAKFPAYRTAETWGAAIVEHVHKTWANRRQSPIDAAMRQAAHEAEYPAGCARCEQRFKTARGLAQHHARSWCGLRAQEPNATIEGGG